MVQMSQPNSLNDSLRSAYYAILFQGLDKRSIPSMLYRYESPVTGHRLTLSHESPLPTDVCSLLSSHCFFFDKSTAKLSFIACSSVSFRFKDFSTLVHQLR